MEGRKEHFLKDINELLSILETNLCKNGKDHYFDLHTGAEDPICGLLNLVFGYELVNKNHEKMNFPGIDLADPLRRIAVQISTDGSRPKINGTLKAFDCHSLREGFDRLIIIVMGHKPNYRSPFDTRGLELEIYSMNDLTRKIDALDAAKVEQIARYLKSAFIFRCNGEVPQLKAEAVAEASIDEEAFLDQLSILQQNYLRRFRGSLIRGKGRDLSPKDLYIPNPYVLGKSCEPRHDLMDLIKHFAQGTMAQWELPIPAYQDAQVLVVEGQQCTGKSTLVANILDCAYFQWKLPADHIHFLSFGERELRSIELTAKNICAYLNLDSEKKLRKGIVIIDALDESDWSSQNARIQLENLMDSLMYYDCRLIVTTRKNYLDIEDIAGILNITLLPFSTEHAERWLDVYATSDSSLDVNRMKEDLRSVPDEVRRVILLPHILQICVTHGIALGSVVNLNQLYQLLFQGAGGLFLRDQYFPNPRAQHRRVQQMMGTAVQIAIKCMEQDNRISTQELEGYIAASCPQMERLKTEYLLERCDGDYYAFAHRTIPSYLIAQDVYEAFSTPEDRLSDHQLLEHICPVVSADGVLSGDVLRSLEQMSRKGQPVPGDRAMTLLQRFLTDRLDSDVLKFTGPYHQAAPFVEMWFNALTRLVFALKAAWRNEWGEYRFFEALLPAARDRFYQLFNRSKSANRSWDYIQYSMMDNWALSELDLSKTNMSSKRIRAMIMQRTDFSGSGLRGAYILDSDLTAARFDEAYCVGTQFSNSVLCSATFKNAKLRGAWFIDCDLSHADLRGADLSKVKFVGCILNDVKINAQQLHDHFGLFELEEIIQNRIKLYIEDCELPDELIADEYRRQRPVSHSIRHSKEIFSGGNIRKAEMVRRAIACHSGSISTAQIMEACPKVSQSTVHRVLRNLIQNGEIRKVGAGRFTAYIWNK